MEVMVASQRISERTKMVKFDLKALQLSNRTRYIQVYSLHFLFIFFCYVEKLPIAQMADCSHAV